MLSFKPLSNNILPQSPRSGRIQETGLAMVMITCLLGVFGFLVFKRSEQNQLHAAQTNERPASPPALTAPMSNARPDGQRNAPRAFPKENRDAASAMNDPFMAPNAEAPKPTPLKAVRSAQESDNPWAALGAAPQQKEGTSQPSSNGVMSLFGDEPAPRPESGRSQTANKPQDQRSRVITDPFITQTSDVPAPRPSEAAPAPKAPLPADPFFSPPTHSEAAPRPTLEAPSPKSEQAPAPKMNFDFGSPNEKHDHDHGNRQEAPAPLNGPRSNEPAPRPSNDSRNQSAPRPQQNDLAPRPEAHNHEHRGGSQNQEAPPPSFRDFSNNENAPRPNSNGQQFNNEPAPRPWGNDNSNERPSRPPQSDYGFRDEAPRPSRDQWQQDAPRPSQGNGNDNGWQPVRPREEAPRPEGGRQPFDNFPEVQHQSGRRNDDRSNWDRNDRYTERGREEAPSPHQSGYPTPKFLPPDECINPMSVRREDAPIPQAPTPQAPRPQHGGGFDRDFIESSNTGNGNYVVQPGDTFWAISRKQYGTARYFAALEEYNRNNLQSGGILKIGSRVAIPSPQSLDAMYPQLTGHKTQNVTQASSQGPSGFFYGEGSTPLYRVGQSDTLTDIAQTHLGRQARWMQIYELNRDQLSTPDRLQIGMVLRLPNDACKVQVTSGQREYR